MSTIANILPGVMSTHEPIEREALGWCLVANIRRVMPIRDDGTQRPPGTRLFAPGAKVWVGRAGWRPGDYERLSVIGRHRKSHRFIEAYVKRSRLDHFRARQYYDHSIERMLSPNKWDPAQVTYLAATINNSINAHVELLESSGGLFDNVLADPNDIAARMVLADWLCERNDPHGPVINAACMGDPNAWTPIFEATRLRLERLWLGDISSSCRIVHWANGFVDCVNWGGNLDVDRATLLARATPLTEIQFGSEPSYLRYSTLQIMPGALEALRSLRTITITGAITIENAEQIAAAAQNMASLERIWIAPPVRADTPPQEPDVLDVLSSLSSFSPSMEK